MASAVLVQLWVHASAPSTSLKGIPAIPVSVFAVTVQEYEENSETDDNGDMLIN
ncbi:hypothetical protein K443DRAFT_4211 [Laccaria amethystina LaAM-08-1]|uniref:Uncharacterized protein n=1 Tax=Laccaria amethystina LaAM-08-1 TaxID=1095629 RepID=A0A0C9WZ35_9AGAR|nr:hypothetical protein K443DRAFT_4211 [Laccaria amethystina LaAM-08-1]